MDLISFGTDTVRVGYSMSNALPMSDEGYTDLLAHLGWGVQHKKFQHDLTGGAVESHTAMFQLPDNPSVRFGIQNAGATAWAEWSAPRLLTGAVANTALVSNDVVLDQVYRVVPSLLDTWLPESGIESVRIRRQDITADIAAGRFKPALIAASANFRFERVRKINRSVFPGETARVVTPNKSFRGYDKALELCSKTDMMDENLMREAEKYMQLGGVRMEIVDNDRRGISNYDVENTSSRYIKMFEYGFGLDSESERTYIDIGGLFAVRQFIDSLDISSKSKSALIAFAVRYAELGEEGMRQIMSKATFYRNKAKFIECGLSLSDLVPESSCGRIDFADVIKEIKAAS